MMHLIQYTIIIVPQMGVQGERGLELKSNHSFQTQIYISTDIMTTILVIAAKIPILNAPVSSIALKRDMAQGRASERGWDYPSFG